MNREAEINSDRPRTNEPVFFHYKTRPRYILLTGGSGLPSADFKYPLQTGRREAGLVVNNVNDFL